MEILAPCGSPEHVKAAVYSGADAVYLGGKNFSARRNAVNFDAAALKEAVLFCRSFGVKVYVTVNILTRDNEMPEMEKYLTELAEAAPDALIVQDMGVASLCKRLVPSMPLHASTQMSVHSLQGVKFCAGAGLTRVVIARECSRVQLEEICKGSPVEIEAFVHGALCVSVSGQCEMSAVIGRRSGNRGLCAQPCRMAMSCQPPYDVFHDYPLSLKDLSLINDIPVLKSMGVAAVKIEGRMKRPEYVAAAVTACRAVLNGEPADTDGLRAVFSREGFTRGYFTGNHADMNGTRVKEDAEKSAEALAKYASLIRAPQKRAPVDMAFVAEAGKPMSLTLTSGSIKIMAEGGEPEAASKRETTATAIREQLCRLGGTPFEPREISVNAESGLFIPVSKLNALRRDACARLVDERVRQAAPVYNVVKVKNSAEILRACSESDCARNFGQDFRQTMKRERGIFEEICERTLKKYDGKNAEKTGAGDTEQALTETQQKNNAQTLRAHCENVSQLEAVLSFNNTEAVLDIKTAVEAAKISSLDFSRVIISPGRFIVNEEKLQEEMTAACAAGFSRVLCQNPAHINLAKQAGFKFLHGGLGLNIFNREALSFYRSAGLADATASMELSLADCRALARSVSPVGLAAYGRLPLMLLRRCPFEKKCAACPGALTDRTNRTFPVACKNKQSFELLNANVLWLADKLNELKYFSFLSLYLYAEGADEARAVISAYQNGNNIGAPPQNFTRGLLYRGVE